MPRLHREARRALATATYLDRSLELCVPSPRLSPVRMRLSFAIARLEAAIGELAKNSQDIRAAKKACTDARRRLNECCAGVMHLLWAAEGTGRSGLRPPRNPRLAAKMLEDGLSALPDTRGTLTLFRKFVASIEQIDAKRRALEEERTRLIDRESDARCEVTGASGAAAVHVRYAEPEGSRARKHLAKRFDRHSKRKAKPQP